VKPEVLVWALLFVIGSGIAYRFFSWVGRGNNASTDEVITPSISGATSAAPLRASPDSSPVAVPETTNSAQGEAHSISPRVAAATAAARATKVSSTQILRPDVHATLAPGTIITTSTPARLPPMPATSAQQFSGPRPDASATIPRTSLSGTYSGGRVDTASNP
jgi:hypothetical protein